MTISQETNNEMTRQMELLRNSDPDLQQEEKATMQVGIDGTTEIDDTAVDIDSDSDINAPTKPSTANHTAAHPYQFIPLGMNGRSHAPTKGSQYLMEHEVSLEDLKVVTHKFYELAFLDGRLDTFLRSHTDPHGDRFANWIYQKLVSGSTIWDQDRADRRATGCPVHDRSSAHVAAWHSPKRSVADRGDHFQLEDCRVWMRLHFWALRQSGLMERSPSFCDYYVRFIAHFVRVYESTAPAFARDSLRWSADPNNTKAYLANNSTGRKMTDVFGLDAYNAAHQIPEEELWDDEWPYNQVDRS